MTLGRKTNHGCLPSAKMKQLARISAAKHILASVFASQRALREVAPEFRWSGLGNLLGDYGELIAIEHYGLEKAGSGSGDFDARTRDGRTVQIKTNFAAKQIGFRGTADLLLVLSVKEDGSWTEIYFGSFAQVAELARFSRRDNKKMIAITMLLELKEAETVAAAKANPDSAG